jgi:integrase
MPVVRRTWRANGVRHTAWGFSVSIGGRMVRRQDASWSKEDAERALAEARLGIKRETETVAPSVTLADMCARYLRHKAAAGKRSIRNDHMAVARLTAHFRGETPLDRIGAAAIADYASRRMIEPSTRIGRPVAPATVNKDLAILRCMLRLAAEWELIAKVPRVRLLREPEGRLRFLSDDEAARLLTECKRAAQHPVSSCRSPNLHPIVVVALNTGMRRGEIFGLTWKRVDFSRSVIQLEKTKGGRRREIPMNQAVYDALTSVRGHREGRVFGPSSVRTAFDSAVARAGVDDFTFHDLRHTFASWLVQRGVQLAAVKELLGHRSLAMTMRYAHLAPAHLRDAVSKLDCAWTAHDVSAVVGSLATA